MRLNSCESLPAELTIWISALFANRACATDFACAPGSSDSAAERIWGVIAAPEIAAPEIADAGSAAGSGFRSGPTSARA